MSKQKFRKLSLRHHLIRSIRLLLQDYGGVGELDQIKKKVLKAQADLLNAKQNLQFNKIKESQIRIESSSLDDLLDNLPEDRWHEYQLLRQKQKKIREQLNEAYKLTAVAQNEVDNVQNNYDELVEQRFHEEFRVSERKTNLGNQALIFSVFVNLLVFTSSKIYFDARKENRTRSFIEEKVDAASVADKEKINEISTQVSSTQEAIGNAVEKANNNIDELGANVARMKEDNLNVLRKVDSLVESQCIEANRNRNFILAATALVIISCFAVLWKR